jgi:predicted nucleic acid-binding protein
VLDNSTLVGWLAFGMSTGGWADSELHAPTSIDYEFLHALRGNVRGGRITVSEARDALDSFLDADIQRHDAHRLLHAMWGFRHDLTAYDASYVALAQALGAPLVTADLRLARTARRWCHVIVPEQLPA